MSGASNEQEVVSKKRTMNYIVITNKNAKKDDAKAAFAERPKLVFGHAKSQPSRLSSPKHSRSKSPRGRA